MHRSSIPSPRTSPAYDVIVQVEADTIDDLGKMVVSRMQLADGVTRTLTCPIVNL